MATLIVGERGLDFTMLNPGDLGLAFAGLGWDLGPINSLTWVQVPTSTLAVGDLRDAGAPTGVYQLHGSGFTYASLANGLVGEPTGGTLNRIVGILDGSTVFDVRDFAFPMRTQGPNKGFVELVGQAAGSNDNNAANSEFKTRLFAGNDLLVGSSARDALSGYAGDDNVQGGGGNDILIGAVGNDLIDGGSGTADTACYFASAGDYKYVTYNGVTAVLAKALGTPAASDGVDKIANVEFLYFSQGTGSLLTGGVEVTLSSLPQENLRPLDYIASYADLIGGFGADAQAGFSHYVYSGFYEGRRTSFNGLEYIASYQDLMNGYGVNGEAGATHYIQHGRAEGRASTFDGLEYVASYTDLMNWLGANESGGASHYISNGRFEGRTAIFDGLEYIASYGDLINGFGVNADAGASHYINNGRFEGRTTTFDGLRYIASYGDLIQGLGANSDAGATHFIQHGVTEGRTVTFNPVSYLNQPTNVDLKNWLGTNYEAATLHYIEHGFFEGRAT